ncbi:MAG: hypothetical protein A2787_05015 [Omnitrophica WOR_2 bacterium RIFCSPHIGHO2_01_FULL_48_9]|nr:MAG: hypothetical protein A3D10_02365 [Omnitrophica WOR_2 bacterium RIFCSPHIGHO2_02_FULL_48_11]OGX30584.1 MAG: hypothetical protein A2787_05015 [Omnitrophica WOR_2 bacterium RIFCSPHIGHO2_01_FULL_48_9]
MEYQCNVCRARVGADMIGYLDHTEKHVIDLVKHDHPDWVEKDGLCKKCLEYYRSEIQGSIFKDAPCALRIRKTKNVLEKIGSLFKSGKGS